MSNYPLVKFVDAPAVGATVRLDLNDSSASASRRVEADFDLGVPTLEGDPDAIGQQFGFRSPRFNVQVKGTKANALAFVSALSKELLRRTNWVMFQLNAATSPVWFRIYRAGYQPLGLDRVYGNSTTGGNAPAGFPDVWRVEAPLVADAFAYGARVSMSTFQVVQSPADLTSPTRTAMHVVLPTIKGDAPTPLRVTITPSTTSGVALAGAGWMVGCISGKTTMSDVVADIGTGDGLTAGAGTATPTTDAAYFTGSYRPITIAAATPNLLQRLSGPLPSVPAGRYKVLIRLEADTSISGPKTYVFQFGVADNSAGSNAVYGVSKQLVVPAATGNVFRGWVDVGDYTLPAFLPMPNVLDTLPSPATVPFFALKIGTADGSAGNSPLRADAIKLVPVDGPTVDSARVLKAVWSRGAPGASGVDTYIGTFDADSESFWLTYNGGLYPSTLTAQGGYPIADPAAARNLLVLVALDHGVLLSSANATVTSKDAQVAVDVSYYPRFLHVGDGT